VVPGSVQLRFRRTEQCIIPYATQEGEISFCAYNTAWAGRNIIEKMHMTATLTSGTRSTAPRDLRRRKKVGMSQVGPRAEADMAHVNSEANHTLDDLALPELPRREAAGARRKLKGEAENARMAKLYREHVLGEKPVKDWSGWIRLRRPGPWSRPKQTGRRRLISSSNSTYSKGRSHWSGLCCRRLRDRRNRVG